MARARGRTSRLARVSLALMICMVAGPLPMGTVRAAPTVVYFPATGHHLSDRFLAFWRTNGGLAILGYPLSEVIQRDGLSVQYFERARFEYHPEVAGSDFDVQLTLVGRWAVAGRDEPAFQPFPPDTTHEAAPERVFFPETGHFLSYGFKRYWEEHGALRVFGFPISEEFVENGRTVQYFERARFEWWPEYQGTEHEVLLGRLGADLASADAVDPQPVPRQPGVEDYAPGLFQHAMRLPVLMYHRLGDPAGRYQMPLWRFEQQLDWLRDNGYTTVTLTQAYDALLGYGTLPPKPVVLTFDDGHPSQWAAAAALDARGMKGVFFITTGQPRMADWQIRDLAERGHEIGSHSVSHPNLRFVPDGRLWEEVRGSRDQLSFITGRRVDFFAYPSGEADARVAAVVEAAGYRGGLAAWGGKDWTPEKRWAEPRIEISGFSSIAEFAAAVQ